MRSDRRLNAAIHLGAFATIILLVLIVAFVLWKSWPFISQIGLSALWQDAHWAPTEQLFNVMPMLAGSILVAAGAVALAAPLGVLLAIFGRYYAPPVLGRFYRGAIELLAGVPSVVYGFWGLVVLVPLIARWSPPGASVLAGIWVLAMMILPLMVIASDNAFAQTPRSWWQAAEALALRRWSTIWRIVLPQTLPGILAGVTLQSGRALGETMAVLMVCGNIVQVPDSLFAPVRTLTANIALEMAYATESHVQALFMSGLVLLSLTIVLVWLAGVMGRLRND